MKLNKITLAILFSTSIALVGCGGGGDGGNSSTGNNGVTDNTVQPVPKPTPKPENPNQNKPNDNNSNHSNNGGDQNNNNGTTNKPNTGNNDNGNANNGNTPKYGKNTTVALGNLDADLSKSPYLNKEIKTENSLYTKNTPELRSVNSIRSIENFSDNFVQVLGLLDKKAVTDETVKQTDNFYNISGFPAPKALKVTDETNADKLAAKLIFNSGFEDTSRKWDKSALAVFNQFNYIPPIIDTSFNFNHISTAAVNHIIDNVMRDDVGRVVVIGDGLDSSIPYLKHAKERITAINPKDYKSPFNSAKETAPSHEEVVAATLLGQPNRIHPNWTGLMSKHGKLAFIHDRFSNEALGSVRSDDFKRFINDGYTIINYSSMYPLDKKTIEKYSGLLRPLKDKETWQEYYDDVIGKNFGFFSTPKNIIIELNKLAKDNPDMLVLLPTGNYGKNGANTIGNLFSLFLNSPTTNPEHIKYIKDRIVFVANQDGLTGKLNPSSSICDEAANICLTSRGTVLVGDYYHYGTSFATPYVTGIAAGIRSAYPFLTGDQIRKLMFDASSQIDKALPEINKTYGHGLINGALAISGPRKFNEQFVVDMGHNYQYAKGNFTFANNISGEKGLTVKGSPVAKNSLTLSGDNTYSGNTIVENFAKLNIEGVQRNSLTYVDTLGHLYGSGTLASLVNNGNVYGYNIGLKDALDKGIFNEKIARGLTVTGDLILYFNHKK